MRLQAERCHKVVHEALQSTLLTGADIHSPILNPNLSAAGSGVSTDITGLRPTREFQLVGHNYRSNRRTSERSGVRPVSMCPTPMVRTYLKEAESG